MSRKGDNKLRSKIEEICNKIVSMQNSIYDDILAWKVEYMKGYNGEHDDDEDEDDDEGKKTKTKIRNKSIVATAIKQDRTGYLFLFAFVNI